MIASATTQERQGLRSTPLPKCGTARKALRFEKDVPAARNTADSGHERRSIEPLDDWTIYREPGTPELAAGWACNQAVLNKSQNLEFFPQLAPVSFVNCILGPLEQLSIPDRTVI